MPLQFFSALKRRLGIAGKESSFSSLQLRASLSRLPPNPRYVEFPSNSHFIVQYTPQRVSVGEFVHFEAIRDSPGQPAHLSLPSRIAFRSRGRPQLSLLSTLVSMSRSIRALAPLEVSLQCHIMGESGPWSGRIVVGPLAQAMRQAEKFRLAQALTTTASLD